MGNHPSSCPLFSERRSALAVNARIVPDVSPRLREIVTIVVEPLPGRERRTAGRTAAREVALTRFTAEEAALLRSLLVRLYENAESLV